ncbi:MAG: type II toxin-antitoxin system RelE/ParE family toxin [Alphaproteobacteria bacterium]|nr:type II toxin-antitoxin system RelE/ParE family toxin [Alphaproteobacteria bacterium]
MLELVYSPEAQDDLKQILDYTLGFWGKESYYRYEKLLALAEIQIRRNPNPLYARQFPSISPSIHGLPLWLVTQPDPNLRVKNPPHIVYYRIVNDQTVEILRILHRSMNSKAVLQRPLPL